MKRFRMLLASAGFLLSLIVPLLAVGSAQAAATTVLLCSSSDSNQIISRDEVPTCDLNVDKQVSVNGGVFAEADTSGAAVSAHVGDTVTWQITVSNNSSDGLTPHGTVYIKDLLPNGVNFVSSSATDGNYIGNDGSFFANHWVLPLLKADGEFFVTTLPATLTITTTATGTGLIQNTATLDKYDPGSCDGGCVYVDSNADNDSNDAWINIQSKPQVLAASTTDPTLTNTGSGTTESIIAGFLLLSTLAIAGHGRLYARRKSYKI